MVDIKNEYKTTEEYGSNFYRRTYSGTALMKAEKIGKHDYFITQIRVIDGIPYLEKLKNNTRISLEKLAIYKVQLEEII